MYPLYLYFQNFNILHKLLLYVTIPIAICVYIMLDVNCSYDLKIPVSVAVYPLSICDAPKWLQNKCPPRVTSFVQLLYPGEISLLHFSTEKINAFLAYEV